MCNLGWKCLYGGKLTLPQSWPCPQLRLLSYSVCGVYRGGGVLMKSTCLCTKASEGGCILAGRSILLLRPITDRWGEVAETPGRLHPPHCAGEISQSNLWTGRIFLHRNLHNHFCLLWIFLAANGSPVAKNKQLQAQKPAPSLIVSWRTSRSYEANCEAVCERWHQCLYWLRKRSYFNMNKTMVTTFYRVSCVLFVNVRVW